MHAAPTATAVPLVRVALVAALTAALTALVLAIAVDLPPEAGHLG